MNVYDRYMINLEDLYSEVPPTKLRNIDEKFRLFSGHTQVNATDLRNLPYPNIEDLEKLGKQLKSEKNWNQNIFDKLSKAVTK